MSVSVNWSLGTFILQLVSLCIRILFDQQPFAMKPIFAVPPMVY
jgi:hypothetical protein